MRKFVLTTAAVLFAVSAHAFDLGVVAFQMSAETNAGWPTPSRPPPATEAGRRRC